MPISCMRVHQRKYASICTETDPAGFIAPCLPTKTGTLPLDGLCIHQIKHDGFGVIARKDSASKIGSSTSNAAVMQTRCPSAAL